MKIAVITFAPLGKKSGASGQTLTVAEELYKRERLSFVASPTCLKNDFQIADNNYISFGGSVFWALADKLMTFVSRVFPFNVRKYREVWFDWFLCSIKNFEGVDAVLFMKPGFSRLTAKLQKQNIVCVGFASILHPKLNRAIVLNEAKRLNVTDHSLYSDEARTDNLQRYFKNLDLLLTQSNLARAAYINNGMRANQVVKLDECFRVSLSVFSPLENMRQRDDFIVLHLSNMSLIKGVSYLLEAWKKAKLVKSLLRLYGSAQPEIRNIAKNLGVNEEVFKGSISNPVAAYQNADVFVSPSLSDLNPFTILESMACGTPVIASSMCGASEIIDHGVDGFIYHPEDVDELARLLVWCCDNRKELQQMGKRAAEKAWFYDEKFFGSRVITGLDKSLSEMKVLSL